LRVITLNVNGVRSAAKKGLFRWLAAQRADVVCLQEMKCQEIDLDARLHGLKAFETCHAFAEKKGYSGVALYSRGRRTRSSAASTAASSTPRGATSRRASAGCGWCPCTCPRVRQGRIDRNPSSLPQGLPQHLMKLRQRGCEIILCGDWNIAHQEIDLRNWRSNQKKLGFLPQERAWLTGVFDELGLSMFSGASTRSPISTPGGRIAGRPGRRTSAGVSITRSPPWDRRHRAQGIDLQGEALLRPRALTIDYDYPLG